jgi:PilZ domain.
MNPPNSPANQRRAPRKRAPGNAIVTDVIRGEPIGHLGNLSSTGLLLITSQAPRSEALYQVRIDLPATGRALVQSSRSRWHPGAMARACCQLGTDMGRLPHHRHHGYRCRATGRLAGPGLSRQLSRRQRLEWWAQGRHHDPVPLAVTITTLRTGQ